MVNWEDYLKDIYFNPAKPASFSGPNKLFRFVQKDGKYTISKYKIRKWLQRQEPYSLQRPVKRNFRRNKILVFSIDEQWSADLMDMVKFKNFNNGIQYVLLVIDVFSKYVWLRPLIDKKGVSVAEAFKDIFKGGRKPRRIRTDSGQEFKAKVVQNLLNKENIKHMLAYNESKAAVSERAIKTVKTKIIRYMTYQNDYKYVDKLQSFATSYNKTYHRTIGMAPDEVTKDKEWLIEMRMYVKPLRPKQEKEKKRTFSKTTKKRRPYRFKIGDKVRISHLKNVFSREYDQKWTGEIFTIASRFVRDGLPIYKLKDYGNVDIKGTFYQSELAKSDVKDDDMFQIEEILKTRGKGKNKQFFVKWLYWPKQFNSWINATEVQNF